MIQETYALIDLADGATLDEFTDRALALAAISHDDVAILTYWDGRRIGPPITKGDDA